MAVTATYDVRQMVTAALRKIGVVAKDTTMTDDEAQDAMRGLNIMLKAWQNKGYNLFNYACQSVTLTTAASYTMDPVRPLRILSVNFNQSGVERPMQRLTRDEYDTLPNKATTGIPTCFYYDKQREAALLYVWPVLAAASGETLEITYEAEFPDITELTDTLPLPAEWWEACVYNLAARMADDYQVTGLDANRVIARAQMSLEDALAADREGSIYFGAGEYEYGHY